MLTSVALNAMPIRIYYIRLYFENRTYYKQLDDFLEVIPDEAAVAATTFYTTKLSGREVLYDIGYASREHTLSADYVLLDPSDTSSYKKYGDFSEFTRFLQSRGYAETDRIDDCLILYQR